MASWQKVGDMQEKIGTFESWSRFQVLKQLDMSDALLLLSSEALVFVDGLHLKKDVLLLVSLVLDERGLVLGLRFPSPSPTPITLGSS